MADKLENKFREPVVQLILALCGHTDAGGFWEEHCEEHLFSIDYTRLAEEWPGVYWHEETKSFLIVYVDDFKLAAKAELHDRLWAAIRRVIDMDPEALDGRFLGCSHERFDAVASQLGWMLDNHPVYHPRPTPGGQTRLRRQGVKAPATKHLKPTRVCTVPTER